MLTPTGDSRDRGIVVEARNVGEGIFACLVCGRPVPEDEVDVTFTPSQLLPDGNLLVGQSVGLRTRVRSTTGESLACCGVDSQLRPLDFNPHPKQEVSIAQ